MVSPQPRRSSPASQPQLVPSIEVVSPWAGAWREDGPVVGHWNPGDQTPLLNNSSPSSDAGERQAVRRETGIFSFNLFSFRRRVPCVQHHRRDGHHRG